MEDLALAGKGRELAWAKDPVDLFFLEIQGSGRIRLDDGTVMRVGYAGQNGRDYIAIGRLLRDRGILPPGGANMQSIRDWIRANPDQGRELMRENLSYIFFKELTGPGPPGALNVPVTARATVAADPNFVPLGAPVYIHDADRREVDGLWVAQDVGGAIKGPNRFDTFWGSGTAAAAIGGGMSAIDRGLEQAIARGERVLLLITGHHRPGEPPVQRGKIRAAVHDWLAASRHAGSIAAVRGAHRRHGGGGSLYIILKR